MRQKCDSKSLAVQHLSTPFAIFDVESKELPQGQPLVPNQIPDLIETYRNMRFLSD
jgi:hypothetical protein